MGQELLESLRRRFKTTEGVVPHNSLHYLHEFGDTVSALLYSALFVPEFIEVGGRILIDMPPANRAQNFLDALKERKMSLAELESSFNFIEIPYLFTDRDAFDHEDEILADKVAVAWRARLNLLFTERAFEVAVLTPDETGSVVGVHFFECR